MGTIIQTILMKYTLNYYELFHKCFISLLNKQEIESRKQFINLFWSFKYLTKNKQS